MGDRGHPSILRFTAAVALLGVPAATSGQIPSPAATLENPIIRERYSSDPAALVHGGRVWLFTGHDEAGPDARGFEMREWHLYSSDDMVAWEHHGAPISVGTFEWARSDAWASQAIERDGRFYFYATVRHATIPGFAIGVAVADHPTGPWRDARGSALITNDMTEAPVVRGREMDWDDIDPTVFNDDDGQAYLFWGNTVLRYARLKENMIELDGPIVELDVPRFTEAPWIHERDGRYYLSYAYGFPEEIAYATADEITGPYEFRGVINPTVPNSPTNHQSIIQFDGDWYFFYHNAELPGGGEFRRSVALERLYYDDEGRILPITQARHGLAVGPPPAPEDTVRIAVDLDRPVGPLEHVWAWFGYDEPNYTYMPDGRKLLAQLDSAMPVPVYVRAHNLLTTGDGTPGLKWGSTNAYTEDAAGNPVYDWTIVDSIFDAYVENGMRPLVEVGFMPEALSTNPQPYRHAWAPDRPYHEIYTGWAYPPDDYARWAELVYQWVRHSVERYGRAEVETWLWEPWNEPDIGYWQGTTEEYLKLYDYTVDAVLRALPTARVGGPHTTSPAYERPREFLRAFLDHVSAGRNYATGGTGSPLHFIAFHAKGFPRIVDGHVRMDLGLQLRALAEGFDIVASYPELRELPVVIGESDPEGCAACTVADNPHNAYRNGTMYSSYTAASFPRKIELADRAGVDMEGAVTWAFQFEDQPWFAGFRSLATNGIAKPVLNAFRMFGMMAGERVEVTGGTGYEAMDIVRGSVRRGHDVDAFAARAEDEATILIWNYHDDDVPAPASPVSIRVSGLPDRAVRLHHYRIDDEHSNAYQAWLAMGSPQNPTPAQYAALERASRLELLGPPESIDVAGGTAVLNLTLPRQGVSLLRLTWP